MQLQIAGAEPGFMRVNVLGEISAMDFGTQDDPLEKILGSGVFGTTVLLGLEQANWIDSSGVAWLIRLNHRFRQGGGRLIVHSVPPRILQVLQLLRTNKVLAIADNEALARAALKEPQP